MLPGNVPKYLHERFLTAHTYLELRLFKHQLVPTDHCVIIASVEKVFRHCLEAREPSYQSLNVSQVLQLDLHRTLIVVCFSSEAWPTCQQVPDGPQPKLRRSRVSNYTYM